MLKQEIEAVLYIYFGKTNTQKDLEDATEQILAYMPNNEWKEYSRTELTKQPCNHWDNKFYDVTFKNGSVGQLQYYPENYRWYEVIAFKPTPVEPFVQVKSEEEILESIIQSYSKTKEFKDEIRVLTNLKEIFLKRRNS